MIVAGILLPLLRFVLVILPQAEILLIPGYGILEMAGLLPRKILVIHIMPLQVCLLLA